LKINGQVGFIKKWKRLKFHDYYTR